MNPQYMQRYTLQESSKPLELSNLYKDLVKELPSKEAKNFSVALAVSCLLQIANEKVSECME